MPFERPKFNVHWTQWIIDHARMLCLHQAQTRWCSLSGRRNRVARKKKGGVIWCIACARLHWLVAIAGTGRRVAPYYYSPACTCLYMWPPYLNSRSIDSSISSSAISDPTHHASSSWTDAKQTKAGESIYGSCSTASIKQQRLLVCWKMKFGCMHILIAHI